MSEENKCLSCDTELELSGYLNVPGTPKKFLSLYHCINLDCPRYGLASVLKLKEEE